MKVIEKGREQKGWAKEYICTGKGNRNGGCGSKLLVEQDDLYRTESHSLSETDMFVTFVCPLCEVWTDIPTTESPVDVGKLPYISQRTNKIDCSVTSHLIEKAHKYAVDCHDKTNCRYGEFKYSYHLNSAYEIGKNFIHLIPEDRQEIVLAAILCHDVIEDTRQTYNDVCNAVGQDVADIVYDVTNELGKDRKERSERTYPKIRKNKEAIFVKLCDRYANKVASKISKENSMYEKYKSEDEAFEKSLHIDNSFDELWEKLLKI